MRWQVGRRRLDYAGKGALSLMGVLNVTPDSFSDGGRYADADTAVAHALSAFAHADIIDVGGESTRPGSDPVPAQVECDRVVPVISALRQRTDTLISIDTSKVMVADAAIEAGADIVNDVTGLADPAMRALVARTGVGAVIMHMRGRPKTMQQGDLSSPDIVAEVVDFFTTRLAETRAAGIADEAICFDPGIGFGKTVEQCCALIAAIPKLSSVGRPILVGASRKSFLGAVTGRPVDAREAATLAVGVCAQWLGAQVLRVHDVAAAHDARLVVRALQEAAA